MIESKEFEIESSHTLELFTEKNNYFASRLRTATTVRLKFHFDPALSHYLTVMRIENTKAVVLTRLYLGEEFKKIPIANFPEISAKYRLNRKLQVFVELDFVQDISVRRTREIVFA